MLGEYVKKDQLLYAIRTREASALNNSLKDDSTFAFKGMINIIAPTSGVISSISHQNGDFVQDGDELAVISEQNSLVFILDTPFEFVKFVEKSNTCKLQLPDNSDYQWQYNRKASGDGSPGTDGKIRDQTGFTGGFLQT